MKKMKDMPEIDRPREKLASRGTAALSETELVEAIIGRGTKNRDVRVIARDICDHVKNNPSSIDYEKLMSIDGVGPTKAAQIMACFELGQRYFSHDGQGTRIVKPEDLLPLLTEMRGQRQEYFICITLNGAGTVIEKRTITVGLLNHSLVHPREVFADAITDRAASVICVHNHPSGSLEPSPQDIAITNQLRDAGALLGIQLLDHVIVTKNGFCSLKERGLV